MRRAPPRVATGNARFCFYSESASLDTREHATITAGALLRWRHEAAPEMPVEFAGLCLRARRLLAARRHSASAEPAILAATFAGGDHQNMRGGRHAHF